MAPRPSPLAVSDLDIANKVRELAFLLSRSGVNVHVIAKAVIGLESALRSQKRINSQDIPAHHHWRTPPHTNYHTAYRTPLYPPHCGGGQPAARPRVPAAPTARFSPTT